MTMCCRRAKTCQNVVYAMSPTSAFRFLGAMNIVGGALSPQKVNPDINNRPSTADPISRDSLAANGGLMRKATSQETINVRGKDGERADGKKLNGSTPTTPQGGRRSSLAGRFLSAITD